MHYRGLRAAALGTTFLGILSISAAARAAGDDLPDGDTIVISAEKFGAGQGRAAFELGKDDIDSRPLGADITGVLNKIPGIESSTGDARGGTFSFEMYLRGLNTQEIGFSVDGIPTGDARFNGGSPPQRFIDSANIGSISVTQSAGDIGAPSRFALGGSIDFRTDAPKKEFGGAIEGGVGDFGFQREYARLDSGEIAPGLSMYTSYDHEYNQVWADPHSAHDDRTHYETKIVKQFDDGSYLKGHFAFNDEFNNDFDIVTLPQFLANPHSDGATDALTGIPKADVNYAGAFGGERRDLLAYINGGLQLGDKLLVTVNPYYQTLQGYSLSYQNSQRTLAGGDPYAILGYNATGGAIRPALTTVSSPSAVGGPVDLRKTPRDRQRYGVTDEVKAEDVFLPGNTIRLGSWWDGGTSTEERDFYHLINVLASGLETVGTPSYVQYARETSIRTTNLYGQDSWHIVPDVLRIDLGATWFHVDYEAASPLEYKARLNFAQNSPVLPKVAVDYRPFDHVELFGGYAKNFAGISEDAFLGSTATITPGEIKPTETQNYDLGARYTQDWYVLTLQGYYVDLTNAVGIVPNDPTVTDPFEIMRGNVATKAANIPGQQFSGIEFAAQAKWDMFDFYGSYSYQHAIYTNETPGSAARLASDSVAAIPGTPVRDIPTNSGYIEIGASPLEGLRIAGTVRYETSRVGGDIVAPNTFKEIGVERIPGFALFGVQARYKLPDIGFLKNTTLQLNVDNLTKASYLSSVTEATATQAELGLPGRTLQRYFIGAPRTTTLSLRTTF